MRSGVLLRCRSLSQRTGTCVVTTQNIARGKAEAAQSPHSVHLVDPRQRRGLFMERSNARLSGLLYWNKSSVSKRPNIEKSGYRAYCNRRNSPRENG